jgi:LmbE family N-acetylglucosaminyl deacetylase
VRPEAIATLAYEGGHPDHDSCSLLGARLGTRFALPVWEAPLYHWAAISVVQQFVRETSDEVVVEINAGELERKRRMCAQYVSQGDSLQIFDARREVVRPQVRYEYGRAPHRGQTNYERWQWWMSARDVSAKFQEFLERVS